MNKNLVDDSSKEKAIKISGLIDEEALRKIDKESDLSALGELRTIYWQGDKENLRRATEARIVSLGGIY